MIGYTLAQIRRFASLIHNIYLWRTPLPTTLIMPRMCAGLQPILNELWLFPYFDHVIVENRLYFRCITFIISSRFSRWMNEPFP